jgi:uncharacterized protein (TIGR03000 family)
MSYPVGTPVDTAPVTKPATGGGGGDKKSTSVPTDQARLIVELPSDAKLYIDDRPMKTPSSRRTFTTPSLQPGQAYYYMVRAQLVRDGKNFEETKRVIVRPGEEVTASFQDLGTQNTARADAGHR